MRGTSRQGGAKMPQGSSKTQRCTPSSPHEKRHTPLGQNKVVREEETEREICEREKRRGKWQGVVYLNCSSSIVEVKTKKKGGEGVGGFD